MELSLSQIYVAPDRQRKDLGDVASLAASIAANGLLQPVVVTPLPDGRYKLQAGERRLRAHQHLQRETILVTLLSDLSPHQQELIELEENVRRKELTWPEYVAAVSRFVDLAEGQTAQEVSASLQLPSSTISKMQTVAKGLLEMPKLATASSWSSAYTVYSSELTKRSEAIFEEAITSISSLGELAQEERQEELPFAEKLSHPPSVEQLEARDAIVPPPPRANEYAVHTSFLEWAPTYEGKRFNLIHCDFPYGLNMDTANLQGSSTRWDLEGGRYDDSPELFDALLKTFIKHRDNFIADSAHIIFWLPFKRIHQVSRMFEACNFTVCEVPLLWHKSDGAGIAPDVRRQPRRTYEIALFATRGDRNIKKVKAASFSSPTTKLHHLSEKPLPVVTHFLEMICDEHSEVLDPTAGSGTALEAALRLGATRVLGLDTLHQHVAHINSRCNALAPASDLGDLNITDL
jgi:ParB/RepB/Spo0J family partition protein